MIRSSDAVVLKAMAQEAGPLPYSSYYCSPDYLEREAETVAKIARANAAAMAWMRAHNGDEIWEMIAPNFSGGDPQLLQSATRRYKELGPWDSDTTLSRESFDGLAVALQRGGLLTRVAPYELICRDDPARSAEASLR